MLELLGFLKATEFFTNKSLNEGYNFDSNIIPNPIPYSWYIIIFIIAFGTAYIAFACNEYESPATRALSTIIAFFFSGFYLIYYFIVHVLFDRKCSSRGINNIVKNISKK